MTGRMKVRQVEGPFGLEWLVTCPEHGTVTWVQRCGLPGCPEHANAMNHAVWHFRNEHVYTCTACYGTGYYVGRRSFIECDACGGTGSIVLMGEPVSPPTEAAISKENRA